jgi:hypothetical protein
MNELLENGEVICPVFNYKFHPAEQIPTKKNTFRSKPGENIRFWQPCDKCTFDVKQPIEVIMSSEELELRSEYQDTIEILIDENKCHFNDGIMHVVAVIK